MRDIDKGLRSLPRELYFTSSAPQYSTIPPSDPEGRKRADQSTLKLGETVRVLHERLPTLLASPLPQEILSPNISLHLFPSTHPHLPTVSGRLKYSAALWTAPVAWGRMPVVGNVKLVILSERMVRNGDPNASTAHAGGLLNNEDLQPMSKKNGQAIQFRPERLIVRWKTCGKPSTLNLLPILRGLGLNANPKTSDADVKEEFCGIFKFEFDEEGRIARHTIEHAEEGGNWESMTRVASVTDWLLGKVGAKRSEEVPGFALGYLRDGQKRLRGRRREDD